MLVQRFIIPNPSLCIKYSYTTVIFLMNQSDKCRKRPDSAAGGLENVRLWSITVGGVLKSVFKDNSSWRV